jgi:hypothetical protein
LEIPLPLSSTGILTKANAAQIEANMTGLPSISIPALVFLGILALILGARFGGWGRGMWPPDDRRPF